MSLISLLMHMQWKSKKKKKDTEKNVYLEKFMRIPNGLPISEFEKDHKIMPSLKIFGGLGKKIFPPLPLYRWITQNIYFKSIRLLNLRVCRVRIL